MHPAHVNFFKNAIRILKANGHEIILTVLDRGKVPLIVKKEFPDFKVKMVGQHKGSFFSIIFQANIFRFFSMFNLLRKEKPDIGFSVGSFILGFGMKLLNKQNFQFDDDPERKLNLLLERHTATKLFLPVIYKSNHSNIKYFNCLKEWAYLSPSYFRPDKNALDFYNLKPKEYIFVREISTGSLNYKDQKNNIIADFAYQLPSSYKYLLSLEDKNTRYLYPESWQLLHEPVNDIHSLMYYSLLVISSGDSMAREAAMLGVHSIYCGTREMQANKMMKKEGNLFEMPDYDPFLINKLILNKSTSRQDVFRNNLQKKWNDITSLILAQVTTPPCNAN